MADDHRRKAAAINSATRAPTIQVLGVQRRYVRKGEKALCKLPVFYTKEQDEKEAGRKIMTSASLSFGGAIKIR